MVAREAFEQMALAGCLKIQNTSKESPASASQKMIDYVICIEPSSEDSTEIDRAIHPDNVINHTTYFPLRQRPVAVGIDTKCNTRGLGLAELQIGTLVLLVRPYSKSYVNSHTSLHITRRASCHLDLPRPYKERRNIVPGSWEMGTAKLPS